MLLNLDGLSSEDLQKKKTEVAERMTMAMRTGMSAGVLAQLQTASEQIDIELFTRQSQEREKMRIEALKEEGKDDGVLNIGD